MNINVFMEFGLLVFSALANLANPIAIESTQLKCTENEDRIASMLEDIQSEIENANTLFLPITVEQASVLYQDNSQYIDPRDQFNLLRLRQMRKKNTMYECDRNLKTFNIFSQDIGNQRNIQVPTKKDIVQICSTIHDQSPKFLLTAKKFINEIYRSEIENKGAKFPDLKFMWHPPDERLSKMVGLASISIEHMRNEPSSIHRIVMNIFPDKICDGSMNEPLSNPPRSLNISSDLEMHPFKIVGGDALNIARFKYMLELKVDQNLGIEFLKTQLGLFPEYKDLYNKPFSKIETFNQTMETEYKSVNNRYIDITREIDNLLSYSDRNNLVSFKEYIDLVEKSITLQIDILNNLLYSSSYSALRNHITKEYITEIYKIGFFNDISDSQIRSMIKSMRGIVNSFTREETINTESLSNIIDLNLSFLGKDLQISYHPRTFSSEKYAKHLLKLTWARFMEIEADSASRRAQNRDILKDLQFKKYIKHNNPLNNHRVHSNSIYELRNTIQDTLSFMIKGEYTFMKQILTQLYLIVSEIDLINDELDSIDEFRDCFSQGHGRADAVINPGVVNNLLSKLHVRNKITMAFLSVLQMQRKTYKDNSILSQKDTSMDFYSLFNVDKVKDSHSMLDIKNFERKVKSALIYRMPSPAPVTSAGIDNVPLSCKEVANINKNNMHISLSEYNEYLNESKSKLSSSNTKRKNN
ncbi:hypothetical protein NEAUS06_0478 [Nematocida ausubeli]|nr:hypothetical protein NEAUS06_0478 [Nematocida ausubeli]